jgi:NADPH2:quinone reductase
MLRVCSGTWDAANNDRPLLVYGAASAVGAAVVKLAEIVSVHLVICVAGRGMAFVEGLIDRERGGVVIYYRKGVESVLRGVREALGGKELEFVFDAISEKGSHDNYWPAMDPDHGKVTFVLGGHREDIPAGIE